MAVLFSSYWRSHPSQNLEDSRAEPWHADMVHQDLKPDNIMAKTRDTMIFQKDAKKEFNNPLPEKQLEDRTIYLSRYNYGPLAKPTVII
jgi:hypothetical protein